jgi:hypothetical protein
MKKWIYFSMFAGLAALTAGCGQGPFSNSNSSNVVDLGSMGVNVVSNPHSLLSGEQVLRGMLSVTGTAITERNQIRTEYNTRSSLFASSYDLQAVTSPMMIAVTNLASEVCRATVDRERILPSEQRKFFRGVDFSRGPASITEDVYMSNLRTMAMSFWGRDLNDSEIRALADGRTEFQAGIPNGQASSNVQTQSLLLFSCTAMLGTFDALTM